MKTPLRVGVAGATGYLGAEILRILHGHPQAEIAALASASRAGRPVGEALPHFRGVLPHTLVPPTPEAFEGVDVALLATPQGVALELAPLLIEMGVRVVDLSGDHRLQDPEAARAAYGTPRTVEAAYGLPEINRSSIADARLVANPGCYPTASVLAALPLLAAGLVQPHVIVDAKSGVSGAGRAPSPGLHYPEMNEAVRAYKIGEHRHEPEIAQTLATAAEAPVRVTFTPHVVPMNRGILATTYLFPKGPALTQGELDALYAKHYDGKPFVRAVPHEPDPKLVRGTNFCDVRPHAATGAYVVTSAIDNLVKGGAGQAVQNLNLMFGLPETTGLPVVGGGA